MKRLSLLIASLVAAWLAAVLFKAEIESRFSAWALHRTNRARGKSDNPLYGEMREAAQKYGADVSFIRTAARARGMDLSAAEIFTKRPGYYDVIVFGDSSLTWSFSPQIVSQLSGKKVAFLGYESALPNQSFVPLAEQISDVYLKKGGLAVFLFYLWDVEPAEHQRTPTMAGITIPSDASVLRQELERSLNTIFALPQLPLYADLIEPLYAPQPYGAKHAGSQGEGCAFYSWGPRANALFLHCRSDNGEKDAVNASSVDLAGTLVNGCNGSANAHIAANLSALAHSKIPIKVIAAPFATVANPGLICETQKLKSALYLLDLPRLAVEKYGVTSLELRPKTHVANASSIPASVVLGKALKDFHQ